MRERANALRVERGQIVADARRILGDESLSVEERNAQFDEAMARADELKSEIDRIETLLATEAELEARQEIGAMEAGRSVDEHVASEEAELRAFRRFCAGGVSALTDEERHANAERIANMDPEIRATMSTGTGSEGGYVIPEGFVNRLEIAALAYSGGMVDPNVVTVLRTATGNPLPMPTSDDTSNTGERIAENTQVAAQDVAFGQVMLNAYLYSSKVVKVPVTLMQDSAFDMNSFLAGRLGERIGRIWNTDLTTGTGTAQPNGIVTAATLGKTAASATAITEDELIDLEHSVDSAYRQMGGRYMFNDTVLALLRKLVDQNDRPLWAAGMTANAPDMIHNYPYTINPGMADPAIDAKTILFGALAKYHTRICKDMTLLRLVERYADYLQVGFLGFARADGDLLDAGTHPVSYLQQAAS